MNQVSEDIYRQAVNAAVNRKIFGKGFFWVTVYGAKGDGIADDSAKISDTVNAADNEGGVVVFPPGTYRIGSNLTIPSNVTLWFMNGAKLSIDSGITVTINGPIDAGLYQIFSGSGSVIINSSTNKEVFPQWFGAKGDGVTDDTNAIQNAMNSISGSRGTLLIPKGIYVVSGTLNLTASHFRIIGTGYGSTIITTNNPTADVFVIGDGTNLYENIIISALRINSSVTKTNGAGIRLRKILHSAIKDVRIYKCFHGIILTDGSTSIDIENVTINDLGQTNGIGVWIDGGNDHFMRKIVSDNPSAAQPFAGVRIQDSGGTWITDCDFIHCGNGLLIDPQANKTVSWLFALNSAFDSGNGQGIIVSPATNGTVKGINFIGCWTASNSQNGIAIAGSGTVNGVRIIGHRAFNNGNQGIYVSAGTNISLDACDVSGNSQNSPGTDNGIYFVNGVSEFSVRNCRSGQQAGYANTQKYGIAVASGASNNYMITNNDVRLNVTAGISDGGTGTNKRLTDNLGFNPVGSITPPSIPASGTPVTNNKGYPVRVFVTGGTVSNIAINGTNTGLTSGGFLLGPGDTITLTYSAAPSWTWFGM
mgnify:CR=1 FL=1